LYIGQLKQKYGSKAQEHIDKYENARWKYLILLDELNRVDEKTFNALRKVILEKNFGPKGDNSGGNLTLPDSAVIIGAINPVGAGTSPFTEHFRDAVDFVYGKANWEDTVKIMETRKDVLDNEDHPIPKKYRDAALNLIQLFVGRFKLKTNKHPVPQQPYYLDIGAEVYVSSREYSDLWATLVQDMYQTVEDLPQDADPKKVRKMLNEAIATAFEEDLSFPITKAGITTNDFFNDLKAWVSALPAEAFVGLLAKTTKVDSIITTMGKYLDGVDLLDPKRGMLENQQIKNAHSASDSNKVIDDVVEMFKTKVTNSDKVQHYIVDKDQKLVTLSKHDLVAGTEPGSLLDNFVLSLLYTLHLSGYGSDRLTAIGTALTKSFSAILLKLQNEQAIDDDLHGEAMSSIVELRFKVREEVNALNPQPAKK
jgi:hypothetical protein